ncbi:hypothetical protein MJM95_29450, partial [Salmonella enterica subsp. enterica serovar Anatum]|nr:hypothetical protein [Salmonella enterica subsp. enterica serovar Anatum]
VHVVGGVVSLCAASGLRTITHCNTVCMVGACVRTDSNTVDGIMLFRRILAFSRFNFDQSSSILNACCIYHWVLEDKYETDKIHPS